MFKSLRDALRDFISKNPGYARLYGQNGEGLGVEYLPQEYDSTPYHTVVNFKTVKTVGEYKAVKNDTIYD